MTGLFLFGFLRLGKDVTGFFLLLLNMVVKDVTALFFPGRERFGVPVTGVVGLVEDLLDLNGLTTFFIVLGGLGI